MVYSVLIGLLCWLAIAPAASFWTGIAAKTSAAGARVDGDPRVLGSPGLLVVRTHGQDSYLACVSEDGHLLAVSAANCPLDRFIMIQFSDGTAALWSPSGYCGIEYFRFVCKSNMGVWGKSDRLDRHGNFGAIEASLGFPPFPATYMAPRAPVAATGREAAAAAASSTNGGGDEGVRVPFFVQTTRSKRKGRYHAQYLELIWIPAPMKRAG